MVEPVKISKSITTSDVVSGLFTMGLFATAFYLIFLRSNKAFAGEQADKSSPSFDPMSRVNQEEYIGRKQYYDNDGKNRIQGFDFPESIEDVNFVKGYVIAMTKHRADDLFGGVGSRALIQLRRKGNSLVYDRFYDGITTPTYEDYDTVKDSLILQKNTYLR